MANLIETKDDVFIVAWYHDDQYYNLIFENDQKAINFMNTYKDIDFQIYKVKSIKKCE